MAILKGKNGVVKIGSVAVANVTSFSVSEEADMLETTSIGANIDGRTYVPGLRQITGTVECNLDTSDANGQMLFEVGATVAITLEVNPGTSYISGNVIITGSNIEVGAADLITASFDFQSNDSTGYSKTALLGDIDETN
jgi:hypothetical protein